jgi:hypothetical protein
MAVNARGHRQHAGVDKGAEVDARRQATTGECGKAGAEHEQEKYRLYEGRDHPQPVALKPDDLAAPDDADILASSRERGTPYWSPGRRVQALALPAVPATS